MDQKKELETLYRKGFMVGNKCEILLAEAIGYRNDEEAYVKFADKGAVVPAVIKNISTVKTAPWVVYEVESPAGPIHIQLGKARAR